LFGGGKPLSDSELSILLAADDAVECEAPAGFDWRLATEKVRSLKPLVERIAGRPFTFDDGYQDASYFAELALRKPAERVIETVFALSFSCFGNLFTDWANCASERLPERVVNDIVCAVRVTGYSYVSRATLELPYSGPNRHFAGMTWNARFFDWI
jgi:hypothetical protein